jgi:hypothetical protein
MTPAFVLLLLAIILPMISCGCIQSYMSICDNFHDVQINEDLENWDELLIGSQRSKLKSMSFKDIPMEKLKKLKSLIILRRINHLIQLPEGAVPCAPFIILDSLNLYGNKLKIIETSSFPKIFIHNLRLVHNEIEQIKVGALEKHKIVYLDLSDNLLERVLKGALPLTSRIKSITIKNNKLIEIQPGSFPSSLQALNLHKNKLHHMSDVLENLKNLRELILSSNKLKFIPKINHLIRLTILDFSFNEITTIERGIFEEIKQMEVLNLSHNKISNPNDVYHLPVPIDQRLTISLALNQLKSVNLTNAYLTNITLVLYGNPWDCTDWKLRKEDLMMHESDCGLNYYLSGEVPHCVDYPVKQLGFKREIKSFHSTIKRNSHLIGCGLEPNKYNSKCSYNRLS